MITIKDLLDKLSKIPGGYAYGGAASYQLCFPLKKGGELRFMLSDDDGTRYPNDVLTDLGIFSIDLYDGSLPPGISGPSVKTPLE